MQRPVIVGFVVVAVVTAGVGAGVLLSAHGLTTPIEADFSNSPADQPATSVATASVDDDTQEFDRTRFEIVVHDDGTGTWTFRHERTLTSTDEREQFEAFAEEFESTETELYERFTTQAAALTANGHEHTGREMAATDFDRSAGVEREINDRGVVEMTFTWENFAVVEDDEVVVSDVFAGGLHLMSDQSLTFRAGDGLEFQHADPETEAQYGAGSLAAASSVTWEGQLDFVDGHPYVVLVPEGEATAGSDEGSSDGVFGGSTAVVAGAILAVIGLIAVAWYGFRRDPEHPNDGAATTTPATDASESTTPEPIPDEELLSDEDRVVALIRQNGGRMKQVKIVDETGWSKSKVSMLLSDMEEEGTISKLRVGRENIISLDGFEPEATKSPLDE